MTVTPALIASLQADIRSYYLRNQTAQRQLKDPYFRDVQEELREELLYTSHMILLKQSWIDRYTPHAA